MTTYLSSDNFPDSTSLLTAELESILHNDFSGSFYSMLSGYQKILADNSRRKQWPAIHNTLQTLFKCGKAVPLDGPMIGIPLSIRDSDYFQDTVRYLGKERSRIASIEWMATAWNSTFADTGLWMGKSFEPVTQETVASKCNNNQQVMAGFDPETSRIGRNFFRQPPGQDLLQGISLEVLSKLWNLSERPYSTDSTDFDGILTQDNLDKEKPIPYSKTGGYFLANTGTSVVPDMNNKDVYQLNYRWPALKPVYPMTRLVDEVVQIAEGIYLGQLVYATKHYSLGRLRLPFCPDLPEIPLGEAYDPNGQHPLNALLRHFSFIGDNQTDGIDYGYQNNGYFLMMDPAYAKEVYADNAFPQLRPRRGEVAYYEIADDFLDEAKTDAIPKATDTKNWQEGWKEDNELKKKFTTFILEPSPIESDVDDIQQMLLEGESILQMLQRISHEISAQTKDDDRLIHFEKLHRLFRRGVAPVIENGEFKGHGKKGYNVKADGTEPRDFYGEQDVARGFDYYHGATLNLHLGFRESFCPDPEMRYDPSEIFPSGLASQLGSSHAGPNLLNITWHSIGKYIFPWAGKSFEKISGRKLSMFLDESDDLAKRYPERVNSLKTHLASAPHYDLVQKNKRHHWKKDGPYTAHLKGGSWDNGMTDANKSFWENEAKNRWIDGNNIQDERIVASDSLMRIIDMNYRVPDPSLQALSEAGPSPFSRQGYIFLGTSDRESILPMNNSENAKKKVFQFHYRYPMIGGPVPIGFCLDELVEIADGLFLGQLIYSTNLNLPYHSSVDPAEYKYQLFGYFLLLDDEWQYHRLAIGLDTWQEASIRT